MSQLLRYSAIRYRQHLTIDAKYYRRIPEIWVQMYILWKDTLYFGVSMIFECQLKSTIQGYPKFGCKRTSYERIPVIWVQTWHLSDNIHHMKGYPKFGCKHDIWMSTQKCYTRIPEIWVQTYILLKDTRKLNVNMTFECQLKSTIQGYPEFGCKRTSYERIPAIWVQTWHLGNTYILWKYTRNLGASMTFKCQLKSTIQGYPKFECKRTSCERIPEIWMQTLHFGVNS